MEKRIKGYLLNCELSRVDNLTSIDLFVGEPPSEGNVTPVTVVVGEVDVELTEEELKELAGDLYFTGSPQGFKNQQEFAKLYEKDVRSRNDFLLSCRLIKRMGYRIMKKEKVAS